MPTVELDIRQLADEGGTEPFAPITVTDAVLDEDGNTLTDTLDEIKSGLTNIETGTLGVGAGTLADSSLTKNSIMAKVSGVVIGSFAANAVVANLPSGFIPSAKQTIMATFTYSGSVVTTMAEVNTDGTIKLTYGSGTISRAFFDGVFFL